LHAASRLDASQQAGLTNPNFSSGECGLQFRKEQKREGFLRTRTATPRFPSGGELDDHRYFISEGEGGWLGIASKMKVEDPFRRELRATLKV